MNSTEVLVVMNELPQNVIGKLKEQCHYESWDSWI